jgi:hypothetical protein
MIVPSPLLEKSSCFSVFQHDNKRSFVVDLGTRSITLTFCELLYLRKELLSFMQHDVLTEMIESGRTEIISLCNNEYFFILLPLEIIDLHKLIQELFMSRTSA